MVILISGGAKNGKSSYAQELAEKLSMSENEFDGRKARPLYYIATMEPHDSEDEARIARHIRERSGRGFKTIEQPRNISELFFSLAFSEEEDGSRIAGSIEPSGSFLLDSTTALLSNEMFRPDGSIDCEAPERVAKELMLLIEEIRAEGGSIVFVSDAIYSDAEEFDEATESYREGLARIDRALAKTADRAVEVSFGSIIDYKPVYCEA